MNIRSLTARTAVAGVSTALAAAGLVGISSTAANAATATNTYTCSAAGMTFDVPVSVTGELPVPQYFAGAPVPPNLLNLEVHATVPPEAAALLAGVSSESGHSDDFAIALGSGKVPVKLAGNFNTAEGVTTWDALGSNGTFTTPKPGQTDGKMPAAFTLTAEDTSLGGDVPIACALAEGQTAQTVASILLIKQSSETAATAPKTVKKTKAVKVTVKVAGDAGAPSGKVVAKEGKKTLKSGTLKNGKAVLNLGKLKVGKHTITVTYAGNQNVGGSSDKVTVKVTK